MTCPLKTSETVTESYYSHRNGCDGTTSAHALLAHDNSPGQDRYNPYNCQSRAETGSLPINAESWGTWRTRSWTRDAICGAEMDSRDWPGPGRKLTA